VCFCFLLSLFETALSQAVNQEFIWDEETLLMVIAQGRSNQHFSIQSLDSRGETLLHLAARRGKIEEIISLFILGAEEKRSHFCNLLPEEIIACKFASDSRRISLEEYAGYRGACRGLLRVAVFNPELRTIFSTPLFAVQYLLHTPSRIQQKTWEIFVKIDSV
jgi:hypothetical protein